MNKCFLLAATLAALLVSTSAFANPDIEITPLAYDFGDVELGSSATVIVSLTNLDPINSIYVYNVSFDVPSPSFSVSTEVSSFPYLLPAGETFYVEVQFTPKAVGYTSVNLILNNSDGLNPVAYISLGGVGIDVEPPTSLDDLLAFYDAAVATGTLTGSGPGNSAGGRLTALRNMIEAAGDLLDDGYTEQACQQLWDAYLRTDGESRPPDFVQGEAAQYVAEYMLDVIASYCD